MSKFALIFQQTNIICDKANSGRIFIYRSCNNKNKNEVFLTSFFLVFVQHEHTLKGASP